MKKAGLTVLVVGMLLMGSQIVSADEHPGIFSRLASGVGGVVTTVVVVTHEVLHVVEQVGAAGMTIVHSGLDMLNIPWTPHTD